MVSYHNGVNREHQDGFPQAGLVADKATESLQCPVRVQKLHGGLDVLLSVILLVIVGRNVADLSIETSKCTGNLLRQELALTERQ